MSAGSKKLSVEHIKQVMLGSDTGCCATHFDWEDIYWALVAGEVITLRGVKFKPTKNCQRFLAWQV